MSSSPWSLDSIASGSRSFDSKRIVYRPANTLGEANLEFFCTGSEISAYLSSSGRRLGTGASAPAKLTIGSECLIEDLPLHEGRMRVKLPSDWTLKAIEALKDGREVAIMVGSIEQTVRPERFSDLFKQLAKETSP